jgi:hypothetical protein
MYLLLSGEGKGDLGVCYPATDHCDRPNFQEGPMALIIDQLVEQFLGYEMSHIDCHRVSFISEGALKKLPSQGRAMHLKGKKTPEETKHFYENARALASMAKEKSAEVNDDVIAILFRDTDGKADAGRGHWRDKRNAMINGFKAESYDLGVAMIPRPKSEAWLICAVKKNPYQHCSSLEEASGNDKSPNALKDRLRQELDGDASTEKQKQLVSDRVIDIGRIDMCSGSIIPDTQIGGNLAAKEVFNEKTTSFLYS